MARLPDTSCMILCGRCVDTATSTAKAFFHTNGMSEAVKSNSVCLSDTNRGARV